MTVHDAAMKRLSQWWKRSMRTGYTYAEGAHLHGAPPERHKVSEARSAWLWGLCLPAALLAGAVVAGPWVLWAFAVYPLQMLRLFLRASHPVKARAWWAFFIVIGTFAWFLVVAFLALRGRNVLRGKAEWVTRIVGLVVIGSGLFSFSRVLALTLGG